SAFIIFYIDPPSIKTDTLSLHDALPIWSRRLPPAGRRLHRADRSRNDWLQRGRAEPSPRRLTTKVKYGRSRSRPSMLRGRGLSRSEEHTFELQSRVDLVCRLLLEKKKNR